MKPFIKWAGGKTELLPVLEDNLPQQIRENKEIDTYIEPFVGAGAFFIYLASNYKFNKIINKNKKISGSHDKLLLKIIIGTPYRI